MTDKITLKPCPFCGEKASIERVGDRRQSTIYSCDGCGCRLETGEEWGHGGGWNKRSGNAANVIDAAEKLLAAIHNMHERGETFTARVSVCVYNLEKALGQ